MGRCCCSLVRAAWRRRVRSTSTSSRSWCTSCAATWSRATGSRTTRCASSWRARSRCPASTSSGSRRGATRSTASVRRPEARTPRRAGQRPRGCSRERVPHRRRRRRARGLREVRREQERQARLRRAAGGAQGVRHRLVGELRTGEAAQARHGAAAAPTPPPSWFTVRYLPPLHPPKDGDGLLDIHEFSELCRELPRVIADGYRKDYETLQARQGSGYSGDAGRVLGKDEEYVTRLERQARPPRREPPPPPPPPCGSASPATAAHSLQALGLRHLRHLRPFAYLLGG